MRLLVPIAFEWDDGNRDKNWKKHGVYFKEVEEVFYNKPLKIFPDSTDSLNEQRYLALGKSDNNTQYTVICTIRESKIRVISARSQSRRERKSYEEK